MTVAVSLGVMVVVAFLVGRWVNRVEDKRNNGGHHQREEIKRTESGFEFVR